MKNLTLKIFIIIYLLNCAEIYTQVTYQYKYIKLFKPAPGRIVGTWPRYMRTYNHVQLYELKYRYGFNYAFIELGNDGTWAEYAGFPKSNWMVQMWATYNDYGYYNENYYYQNRIDAFGNVYAYYVDEPEVHENYIDPSDFIDIKNYLSSNNNSSLSGTGDSPSPSDMNEYALYTDFCMYTNYAKCAFCGPLWYCGPIPPCFYGNDQRDGWSIYRNLVIRFNHTWISGRLDIVEDEGRPQYFLLCGHANNIGLEGIWFYQQDDPHEEESLIAFCEAAVQWNDPSVDWLEVVGYQHVKDKYNNGVLIERTFDGPILSYVGDPHLNDSYTLSDETFYMEKVVNYHSLNDLSAENFVIPNKPDRNKCDFYVREQHTITLKPGFHAEEGSEFRAYILGGGEADIPFNTPKEEELFKVNNDSTQASTVDLLPKDYNISQNYPNPFNPSTIIKYQLPKDSRVILEVYNVLGEKITTLVDELKPAGFYQVHFNGNTLPSGLYIYRINAVSQETGEVYEKSSKMMLVK